MIININMKKTIITILICCMVMLLCACGKIEFIQEESHIEETEQPVGDLQNISEDGVKEEYESSDMTDLPNEVKEPDTQKNSDDDWQADELDVEEWKSAYLSYLDSLEYADSCTYSLIYVDEDDIPELMIDSGFEAGGCLVITFHDGIIDEWQSSRLNVSYIEKGNLICNSDGNMGHYYDNVYTIQDGKWRFVDGGQHGDGPDGVQFDENGNYIYIEVYYWNNEDANTEWEWWSGEEISEEEYNARLNNVYPMQQATYPERYYILKEICSVLSTADVSSAEHHYELVVEDLTWTEAEALCREKGGYLAAITSWEELERIQEQMVSENKTDITFFVGARNPREENGRWGYCWIDPESGSYYEMLDLYNALFGFWLDGEPSYTGLTEDGVEVREDYVVLFYRKSDERCYINDVPDDILSAAPSYSGKVGYICEYNG